MCVINNCVKEYCLHFSMAVRERVALFVFIVIYLMINCINCLPINLSRTPKLESKIKKSTNANSTVPGIRAMLKTNLKNVNVAGRTMNNAKQENLCEKFNFPEIEYPTASEPNIPLHFRESAKNSPKKDISSIVKSNKYSNQSPYSISYKSKTYRDRNVGKKQNYPQRPENKTIDEFSSAPNYRDMGVFPEVEYPQKAKDIWRPNYWNCPPKVVKSTQENPQNNINSDYKAAHRSNLRSSLHPFTAQKDTNLVNEDSSFWSKTSKKDQKSSIKPSKNVSNQTKSYKYPLGAMNHDFQIKDSQCNKKIPPEIKISDDNYYTATPTPQCIKTEDLIKTALYAKIYSNIANKAISSIKNILKSDKSNTTTEYYGLPNMKESDILEDILRFSHPNLDDYDSDSLFHNNYYATTPRITREFAYSSEVADNITEPWINVFTAFTEKPEIFADIQNISTKSSNDSHNINHYSQSITLHTTSTSRLIDAINKKPDATTLSPRALIYDDRKLMYDKNNASILGQSNECDVGALDTIGIISYGNDTDFNKTHIDRNDKSTINTEYDSSLKLDDEYTTDVYPEVKENRVTVLSTAAPLKILEDPSWANSEIIDPYKSISYPDELGEYYIAVG